MYGTTNATVTIASGDASLVMGRGKRGGGDIATRA
jgi:hypothetical protein